MYFKKQHTYKYKLSLRPLSYHELFFFSFHGMLLKFKHISVRHRYGCLMYEQQ